jgi:hypothetical protein
MPVKHRKLGARKGNDALAAVRDEMKETLAVIEEEAALVKGTEAGRSAIADRFPAVGARK